ncbi:Hypothetical_protein [Hexamita inflata]|uniref:Hypothetical_protein n=1 Tax=Hexamita inflata TaxID=28002 RepID=A0ABP1JGE6_9EUKA
MQHRKRQKQGKGNMYQEPNPDNHYIQNMTLFFQGKQNLETMYTFDKCIDDLIRIDSFEYDVQPMIKFILPEYLLSGSHIILTFQAKNIKSNTVEDIALGVTFSENFGVRDTPLQYLLDISNLILDSYRVKFGQDYEPLIIGYDSKTLKNNKITRLTFNLPCKMMVNTYWLSKLLGAEWGVYYDGEKYQEAVIIDKEQNGDPIIEMKDYYQIKFPNKFYMNFVKTLNITCPQVSTESIINKQKYFMFMRQDIEAEPGQQLSVTSGQTVSIKREYLQQGIQLQFYDENFVVLPILYTYYLELYIGKSKRRQQVEYETQQRIVRSQQDEEYMKQQKQQELDSYLIQQQQQLNSELEQQIKGLRDKFTQDNIYTQFKETDAQDIEHFKELIDKNTAVEVKKKQYWKELEKQNNLKDYQDLYSKYNQELKQDYEDLNKMQQNFNLDYRQKVTEKTTAAQKSEEISRQYKDIIDYQKIYKNIPTQTFNKYITQLIEQNATYFDINDLSKHLPLLPDDKLNDEDLTVDDLKPDWRDDIIQKNNKLIKQKYEKLDLNNLTKEQKEKNKKKCEDELEKSNNFNNGVYDRLEKIVEKVISEKQGGDYESNLDAIKEILKTKTIDNKDYVVVGTKQQKQRSYDINPANDERDYKLIEKCYNHVFKKYNDYRKQQVEYFVDDRCLKIKTQYGDDLSDKNVKEINKQIKDDIKNINDKNSKKLLLKIDTQSVIDQVYDRLEQTNKELKQLQMEEEQKNMENSSNDEE